MSLASAEHRRAVAAIAQAVACAERIVVASHAYPDADAVGSLLALTLALQARGKTVTPCLPTRMEDAVRSLPGAAQVRVGGAPGSPTPDVVFVLDCSALARIDPLPRRHPEWFEGRPLVNIDHHGSNEAFGAINLVDPGAVSTASILYELLPALDVALTPEVAQCLLTGVLGDSQVFTTPSTDAAALEVAAALVSAGASYQSAVRAVHALELARVRYWGAVLNRLELLRGGRVALLTTSLAEQEAAPVYDPSEGLADFLTRVDDVDIICLLVEREGGEIKGSLRTASPRLQMKQIACRLGGGGHDSRAGFSLFGLSMAAARAKVLAEIDAYLAGAAGQDSR